MGITSTYKELYEIIPLRGKIGNESSYGNLIIFVVKNHFCYSVLLLEFKKDVLQNFWKIVPNGSKIRNRSFYFVWETRPFVFILKSMWAKN